MIFVRQTVGNCLLYSYYGLSTHSLPGMPTFHLYRKVFYTVKKRVVLNACIYIHAYMYILTNLNIDNRLNNIN